MENLPQQQYTFSPEQLIKQAIKANLVRDSSIDELRNVIRYACVLLGITKDKTGDDVSKLVLLNHIKKSYGSLTLEEIRLAFDFAVDRKYTCNLTLYQGEFISAKFVGDIIAEYILYKRKFSLVAPKHQMNNIERVSSISNFLNEGTKEALNKMTAKKSLEIRKRERTFEEQLIQDWIVEFDVTHKNNPVAIDNGRFIEYNGVPMNIDKFLETKMTEYANTIKK